MDINFNSTQFDVVDDSFQSFLVDGAKFTPNEEYPIIEKEMVPEDPPLQIMPFDKALNYRGDLKNTYICSYSPDKTFERIRKNPKKYVSFFKRTAGIIGFDFSIHSDMPVVKQKSQINDNLSLTYYYGKQDIPVIPNVRCGSDKLLSEFLCAIPEKSIIAIGTHGFIKTKHEQAEWYCFIEEIIKQLSPSHIVVYGTLRGINLNEFHTTDFVFYDSWIDRKRKQVPYVY